MASNYNSPLSDKLPVIGDDNFESAIKLADVVGYGRGLLPKQADDSGPFKGGFDIQLIPESEWKERIEEREAKKATNRLFYDWAGIACKNQKSTNYCWIFAATTAVEHLHALKTSEAVELSPASAGSKITGFRNVGGWSTRGVRYIAENGVVPTSLWPDTAIDRDYDKAESWEAAKRFRVTEWMELDEGNFPQVVTCMLLRIPLAVGYSWWSHAIVAVDVVIQDGEVCLLCRNSWGSDYGDNGYFVLKGKKKIPDDAVAPRSMVLT